MAILSAILSLLSKKLGDLVQALFGWSITGLFGRLPRQKQIGLSVAMLLSVAWPLLVVGVFLPKVAAWALAFLPLQRWLGKTALRVIWIVLALAAPLCVGLLTAWVAPREQQRGGAVQTMLSGFPLTLGFALALLITFFIIPALKVAAAARGWTDEHVYVQVKKDSYLLVLQAIADACTHAGLAARVEPMPKAMQLPTRLLRWFARGALEPVVAHDPVMLRLDKAEAYLYPADLMLRGDQAVVARIRAALVRKLSGAPAYLVADPAAQHIQDEIDRMWQVVHRHHGPQEIGALGRQRVREIARELDRASIPFDDWMILYSDLFHLERGVCGDPHLVDREEGQAERSLLGRLKELVLGDGVD